MMRIALGSDHRGGFIAKTILSEVLFPENCSEFATVGFDLSSAFVGACLVTGDVSKTGGIVGKKVENILPVLTQAADPKPADPKAADFKGEEDSTRKSAILRVDYPDIAAAVAEKVSTKQADFGILTCGTGIGMCIVANKFRHVRAAVCANEFTAEMSRRHNDANVLCIPGDIGIVMTPAHNDANVLCIPGELLGGPSAVALVRHWLSTSYDGGRHQLRLEKINRIEEETGL